MKRIAKLDKKARRTEEQAIKAMKQNMKWVKEGIKDLTQYITEGQFNEIAYACDDISSTLSMIVNIAKAPKKEEGNKEEKNKEE